MSRIDNLEEYNNILLININPEFEYFCTKCKQLRLSCDKNLITCGNCGNPIVDCVRGKVGELNKESLLEAYKNG